MTGDERLAKVAEVLASLEPGWDLVKDCTPGQIGWASRLGYLSEAQSKAERFALLLEEFRAEDEARGSRREAADTLWRIFLRALQGLYVVKTNQLQHKPFGLTHPTWKRPDCFLYDSREQAQAAAIRAYGEGSVHRVVAVLPAANPTPNGDPAPGLRP